MASLKVSFENLESVSSSVNAKGEEFGELLTRIKEQNHRLESAWMGTDATKYTEAVAKQAMQIQELENAIKEIGAFLQNVSAKYREAQEENRNAINNI